MFTFVWKGVRIMNTNISIIKGIHPGIILDRELKKRRLSKKQFAKSIDEFPQTLGAITKGKRRINPSLSVRIGEKLRIDESYFMILQAYYDIEQEKRKQQKGHHPDLSKIRPVVFWDTNTDKMDWIKYKPSIIKRVFERGNEQEKQEIVRFYGKDEVSRILERSKDLLPG
jgi:plasmid maintenance system antidote protein VapI